MRSFYTHRPARLLAALGLLAATAEAAQAQTPTFAAVSTYSTGAGSGPYIGVAVADVNGDGRLDIVTANVLNQYGRGAAGPERGRLRRRD